MELLELLQKRRSIRKYAGEVIASDKLEKILQAGLLAPSGKAIYPVRFILVRGKSDLEKLSQCKAGSAAMLKSADAAIVVAGDTARSDTWVEDCSIAMTLMQLEAAEQSVGSCWVQCRGRSTPDGASSEDYIRSLFDIPESFGVLAVLSLGIPAEIPEAHALPEIEGSEKVRE